MYPRRPLLPALVLVLLLPLLPGRAAAVPVAPDGLIRLAAPPAHARAFWPTMPPDTRPLARVRLLAVEVTLLPSGRLLHRTIVDLPPHRPLRPRPPGPDPLVLPLPGAMPLLIGALAGLFVVGRRRRRPTALAAADGAP